MAMPTWISELQAFSAIAGGIAVAVIAGVGVAIARRQAHTAGQKLRLDLFPMRYDVFKTVSASIRDTLDKRGKCLDYTKTDLEEKIQEARFLFDAPTFEHISRISGGIYLYQLQQAQLQGQDPMNNPDYDYYADAESKAFSWLLNSEAELIKLLERSMKIEEHSSFSSITEVPTT